MINRNVALEDKLLNELMKKRDYTDNKVTGAVLSGVAAMYKATGDEKFLMALKLIGNSNEQGMSIKTVMSQPLEKP